MITVFIDEVEQFHLTGTEAVEELKNELKKIGSPYASIRATEDGGRETIYLHHYPSRSIALLRRTTGLKSFRINQVLSTEKELETFEFFLQKDFFKLTAEGLYVANSRVTNFLKAWDKFEHYRKRNKKLPVTIGIQ